MSSDGESEDNTSASSSAASSSDESSSGDSPQTTSAGDVPGKPWRPLRALNAALTHLAEALCHAEARLRQERRAWAEAGADTQRINEGCQQCCYLDVGGTPFHTLRDVLTNSGSYFAKAARPDTETEGTFIDRDGQNFAAVLSYMRDGSVWVPEEGAAPPLPRELRHYGLLRPARRCLVFPHGEPCVHGDRWACLTLAVLDLVSLGWEILRLHTRVPDAYRVGCCEGGQLYVAASFDRRVPQQVRRFDLQEWRWHPVAELPTRYGDSRSPFSLQLVAGHLCLFDDHGRSDVLACRLPDGAWVPHQLRDIDPQGYTCALGDRLYALGRQGLVSSTLGDAAWRVEPGTPYVSDSTMVAWQGKVLLVGGQDAGAPDGICHLVHVYDPETQGWSQLPPMRHHRTLPAVAVAEDGALYVVGGGGRCPLPAERYDAATRHWAELGPAPLFRCMAGFAAQL